MAGLLNLIPRYLPRYGMAPEWARAHRPIVLIITGIAVLVTWIFDADVDKQAGAYATGVLVLMTSVAFASAISTPSRRAPFGVVTAVFVYATVDNIIERPEGLRIATWFIVTMVTTSLVSRVMRSTELRAHGVTYDEAATRVVARAVGTPLRIIANRPDTGLEAEYAAKIKEASEAHHLPPEARVVFLEIYPSDASEFSGALHLSARHVGPYEILSTRSPAIPNAIAAILLALAAGIALGSGPHWGDASRLFRLDGGEPDYLSPEIPGLRRGRHRPRRP